MNCQACGNENPENAHFCGVCGVPLSVSSPNVVGALYSELSMVSFPKAIKLCFSNYSKFSGRATRAEYWWWWLFTLVAFVGLIVVDRFMGALGLLSGLFVLATIVPSLALGARRLHDINRSGWWLLGYLGYFVLFIPGLVMAGILIIWACGRGDEGPNRYGPDPRQAPPQQPDKPQ